MVANRIRVLLVDDHELAREGLRRMLELERDIQVVGETSSGEEALALVARLSPEIVLMDLKMSTMGGIETTRLIKQQHPECKVVVLTLYAEYLADAIQSGADGYLLKDLRREDLIGAIREIHRGRSPLRLTMERVHLAGLVTGASSPSGYSERELAVLRLVADGVSGSEIARQMAMSEATVKRAMRSVFEKLGVRNRAEAVAEAMRRKLI